MQTSPRTRQRLFGIFLIAVLLLNGPLMMAVSRASAEGSNAWLPGYLFVVWALLILALALPAGDGRKD